MINKIIVHNSVFHADDVACVAIARMLNPAVEWSRTSNLQGLDVNSDDNVIVADIGFGRFDHHGKAAKTREDGGKHSAATLMWERFGIEAVQTRYPTLDVFEAAKVAKTVMEKLLYTIANGDNGIYSPDFTINVAIAQFNALWDDKCPHAADVRFLQALQFMETVLKNTMETRLSELRATSVVTEAIRNSTDGIIVLECFAPWKHAACANENMKVVVFPSARGGWSMQLVPVTPDSFETRIHVPESWCGKQDKEAGLEQKGMTFCHRNGFISSFDSKEHAIEAAEFLVHA